MCVLVPQGEANDTRTLLQLPVFRDIRPGELHAAALQKLLDLSFSLTATDGCREDDISCESLQRSREQDECFRSLFEAERCPAPFVHGSQFYCFHCPGTLLKNTEASGLSKKTAELLLLSSVPLCSHADREEGRLHEGQSEEEEKLALMYERLQIEVRAHRCVYVSVDPHSTMVGMCVWDAGSRESQADL